MSDTFQLTTTNSKLVELSNGLAGLDGLRAKGEVEPFLFEPEIMWAIAENQTLVTDRLRSFEKARKALAARYKVTDRMAITAENGADVAAFVAGLDELQDATVVLNGLKKISRAKLNVGHDEKKKQNKIPPSVLANLNPLLED